jgi:hypothetical protein
MTRFRCAVIVAAVLRFHGVGLGADEPIKISTINDHSQPASVEMMKLFRQKIAEHAALFKLVGNDDASLGLVFQADWMPRQSRMPDTFAFTRFTTRGAPAKRLWVVMPRRQQTI